MSFVSLIGSIHLGKKKKKKRNKIRKKNVAPNARPLEFRRAARGKAAELECQLVTYVWKNVSWTARQRLSRSGVDRMGQGTTISDVLGGRTIFPVPSSPQRSDDPRDCVVIRGKPSARSPGSSDRGLCPTGLGVMGRPLFGGLSFVFFFL